MKNSLEDYQNLSLALIGVQFKDITLLQTAFTHRSYLNEHRNDQILDNERLEFLGDAVLEIIVTDYLYRNYSEEEGVLTNWRAALVRTESIAAAASRLKFYDYLRLSKGEKSGTDRARLHLLANAFEAVVGAIYLDQGYKMAADFVNKHIISTLKQILDTGSWLDSKTQLQEIIQNTIGETPTYKLLSEQGPDHDKVFVIGVYIGNELCGQGRGYSKQLAQQQAARQALDKQLWTQLQSDKDLPD